MGKTKVPIDPVELAWRAKSKDKKKRGLSHTDMAAGCITCVQCKAWPDVHYWTMKKKSESHWSILCNHCFVPGLTTAVVAATHAEAVAAWNDRHKRWT